MSRCPNCESKHDRVASEKHKLLLDEFYSALMPALRRVAYRYGYALAVHGSLNYDIDLIAVPWIEMATNQQALYEGIKSAVTAIIGFDDETKREPTKKPNGRLAYSIHLTPDYGDGPYIDLSVMPPINDRS